MLGWAPGSLHAQQTPQDTAKADTLPRALLPPLVVSITRADRPLDRVPYSIHVLEGEELRRGRATLGLDEALAKVPGILVQNRYNFAQDQKVSIRGFGARSAFGVRGVRVLLDGIPQTLPDGQGQLTNIELGEIAKVELLTGASSALYGNAAGGVVSLTSITDRPHHVRPAVRAGIGSFGMLKWQGRVDAPLGAGSAHLTVSRTTMDGFREHSAIDLRHVGARIVRPLGERTELLVTYRLSDNPVAQNPGSLTRAEMDSAPAQASARNLAFGARKAVEQGQGGLRLRHRFPGGGALEVTGFGLRRWIDNPLSFAVIELLRWTYGTRAQASLPFSAGGVGGLLTAGLDAQWQRDRRTNRDPVDPVIVTLYQMDRVFELGPFLQAELELGRGAAVTAGMRYDRVRFAVEDSMSRLDATAPDRSGTRTLSAVSSSGGLTVSLAPSFVPYVSVATSFETPTTTELINRPDGAGGLNTDLEPQHATNFELGVRGRVGTVMEYSLALFDAQVTDELIPFESPTEPGRTVYRNAGSSTHRGLESRVALRSTLGVRLSAAHTYADYRFEKFEVEGDTLDGNRIPGVPRHYLHVSAEYGRAAGFWIAVDNTLSSSMYVDDRNTEEAMAEGWWTVTARAGWNGSIGRWRLAPFVSLLNLFDRRHAGSVVVNARFGRYYEPAPGRNVLVGAEIGAMSNGQ
ncbi:MAG: TonB-dependent receptor family protein [Gemmatimonadales bacterium]